MSEHWYGIYIRTPTFRHYAGSYRLKQAVDVGDTIYLDKLTQLKVDGIYLNQNPHIWAMPNILLDVLLV